MKKTISFEELQKARLEMAKCIQNFKDNYREIKLIPPISRKIKGTININVSLIHQYGLIK